MLFRSEWGLHRFSNLTQLIFEGPMLVYVKQAEEEENPSSWCSFSVDGMLLPNSLIHLSIRGFPSLKKLSFKDFQNHASLHSLSIWLCPSLASLPKQGLPPSLSHLSITESPKLKRHFEKEKGKYSHLIYREIQDRNQYFFSPHGY